MPHGRGPRHLHFLSLGRGRWLQRGAGDSPAWISSSWAVICSLTFCKEWYTPLPGTQDESQDPGHGECQKSVEIEMPTAALHNNLILYARLQIITDIQRYTSEQDRVSALLNTYMVSCSSGYLHFHSVAGDDFTFLILHSPCFNGWDYRCHHLAQFIRQTQSFKHAGQALFQQNPNPQPYLEGFLKVCFHMCACLYAYIHLCVPCARRNWNYEDFDLPDMGD